ncbi:MAG: DinB family protein [Inquilinaceae bacterium]
MSLIDHFRMLATYNRLANQRLYAACAALSDAERRRERPAFFRSIHGTLNHIMVGDRIWLARFEGDTAPSTGLDAILYDDFTALTDARTAEDARIEAFAGGLTASFLAGHVAYRNNQGRDLTDPVALLVAHFFNHQTHHRGQVHGLLSQTDVPPPSLDMHRLIQP